MTNPNASRTGSGSRTLIVMATAVALSASLLSSPAALAAAKRGQKTTVKKTASKAAGKSTTSTPTTAAPTNTVAATIAAGVQQAANAAPLVIAVPTEPSTLDPQLVNDRSTRVVTSSIFETLLFRDKKHKVQPLLAESYNLVNPTTWRFVLRKGITFHNGDPFNADSVVLSFTRILDPKFGTQRTSYLEAISKAVKVDDYTVDVVTTVPSATLPIQVTAIPMIPVKGAATLGTNPIGTGPYKFDEWNRGRYVAVKRNDAYWGANKGKIAEYRVRVIPDNQTALAALQTGEVDLVLDLLPEQRALAPKYASVGSSEFSYGAFNTYKKELSDKRVRLAINMAIDRNKLVQTIFQGQAKPNDSQHLTEGMLGYNDKLGPYPYDLDKARALMKAAGYEYGMNLTINVPIGRYLKAEETAEFIASSLAKININVEVKRLDFDTFRSAGRIKGTAAGAMDIKLAWNSNEFADGSRIIAHITCDGSSSKYCNKEVDKLMDEATKTQNQDERAAKYQKVWALLYDDPYSIMLLQQNLIYGLSKRLQWEPRLDDEYYIQDMITTR